MKNRGKEFLDARKGYVSDEELKILECYYNRITYTKDDDFDTILHACLACIISKILKGDNPYVEEHKDTLINIISVDNITRDLKVFCDNYIPISMDYLKYLDIQAEMVLLFCRNYVFGLVDRVNKNPDKIKRLIKLKTLEYEENNS